MKVTNKTDWDTISVKKILSKVLSQFQKVEERLPQADYLKVELRNTVPQRKSKYIMGCICGYRSIQILTKRDLSFMSLEDRIKDDNRHHTEDVTWYGCNREVDHIEEAACSEGDVKLLAIEEISSKEYVDGCAYIGGRDIVLRLPKKATEIDLSFQIAWVFWHELYHILGIKSHRRIPGSNMIQSQVEWSREIPVLRKGEEKKEIEYV